MRRGPIGAVLAKTPFCSRQCRLSQDVPFCSSGQASSCGQALSRCRFAQDAGRPHGAVRPGRCRFAQDAARPDRCRSRQDSAALPKTRAGPIGAALPKTGAVLTKKTCCSAQDAASKGPRVKAKTEPPRPTSFEWANPLSALPSSSPHCALASPQCSSQARGSLRSADGEEVERTPHQFMFSSQPGCKLLEHASSRRMLGFSLERQEKVIWNPPVHIQARRSREVFGGVSWGCPALFRPTPDLNPLERTWSAFAIQTQEVKPCAAL